MTKYLNKHNCFNGFKNKLIAKEWAFYQNIFFNLFGVTFVPSDAQQ